MNLASRKATFFTESGIASTKPPWLGTDKVVFMQADRRALIIRGLNVAERRTFTFPESTWADEFGVKPTGDSVAVVVVTPSSVRLAISPLTAWSPRFVHRFGPGENTGTLSWSTDGSIYFWMWPPSDNAPGVWRVTSSGGRPVRERVLPTACNTSNLTVATAAPRGVCQAMDMRGDIWLLSVPGVTR